jgi:hypothetical protein
LVTKRTSPGLIIQTAPTPTLFFQPTFTPAPTVPIGQSRSKIDEQFYKDYTADEARINPDLTVNNNAPFENDLFRIETQFVIADPGYFKVLVFLKKDNQKMAQQEVTKWFKSIGIPDESLEKLKIEYTLYGIPKAG